RFGVFQRAGNALVPLHRADAGVKVKLLSQRHVETAEATADWRGQRAFDAGDELAPGVERLAGHVVPIVQPGRFLSGVNLHPGDLARAAVCLLDGCVPDALGRGHNVPPDAIPLNERNNRVIGHARWVAQAGDLLAIRRDDNMLVAHAAHAPCDVCDRKAQKTGDVVAESARRGRAPGTVTTYSRHLIVQPTAGVVSTGGV